MATSYGSIIDLLKLWTQSGQEAERKMAKIIEKGIDRITERKSDLFAKFKKGPDLATPVKRWMEQYSYELKITGALATSTLTFSGYLLGAAVTANAVKQHVKIGTVLEDPTTGLQMKVTAVGWDDSPATLTATVEAYGNSGSLADFTAKTLDIIGDISSDYDDNYVPRGLDRNWREVGTQVWKEFFEIPWTKKNTKMEAVADEMAYQIKEITENLQKKIARAAIRMRPYYNSGVKYGLNTESPSMCGVCSWVDITQAERANANVNVNASASGTAIPVSPDMLNALIYNAWIDEKADYGSGQWYLACHPIQHQYISDFYVDRREFGFTENKTGVPRVEKFRSKIGREFDILPDENVRIDSLYLIDVSDAQWGYYSGYGITVKDLPETVENIDRKKITCQTWGVMLRKPRQSVFRIYGLPTSYE